MISRCATVLCPLLLIAQLGMSQAPSEVSRGRDREFQIDYVLISVSGKLLGVATPPAVPPRLTARCTGDAAGHIRFQLLADLGDVPPPFYVPPWRPVHGELFPPVLQRRNVVMNFYGYRQVKPVKRQWLVLEQPAGEYQYNTPGMGSSNMEEIAFYLQYLKALPTLRLSFSEGRSIEFETTAWQAMVHAEPLCKAAAL